jgi:hypothetical protein
MITVRTKNGSTTRVPEATAKKMVAMGASIVGASDSSGMPVPVELQPVPMKTSPQQTVNDNELLLKENAELKAKNAKLANDIIALLKEVESLKEQKNDNVPVDKKAKKGSKTVNPNG